MPQANKKEAVYDRFAPDYERVIGWLERHFMRGLRARTLAQVPFAKGPVLEIGAGTGLNFGYYPPDAQGIASELSHEMLALAAQKSTRPAGVKLLQADAQALPLPDNSFAVAFCTLVFCSVPDAAQGLAEVRRVLRPDGVLVMLEHVRAARWWGAVCDAVSCLTVPLCADHFNRRTAETVAQVGFSVTQCEEHAHGVCQIITARANK